MLIQNDHFNNIPISSRGEKIEQRKIRTKKKQKSTRVTINVDFNQKAYVNEKLILKQKEVHCRYVWD